ncbi:hypothetical protein I6E29_08515 [Arcanobacterium haemolyticum]|nr:hypothetical protein [Arcanobacterium haemolyticum]
MITSLRIAPLLAAARMRQRTGNAWLDLLAVASFILGTLLALTVGGGVWMFYQWAQNPSADILETVRAAYPLSEDTYRTAQILLVGYFQLALIAGALLVFPIFSLGASAARLGARGRATRLASLRLVGATGAEVVAISVLETLIQWCLGAIIGTAAYILTLPGWRHISFLGRHITPSEMSLPLGFVAFILGVTLVICLVSTIVGLHRVWIEPLGVAHRDTPPALKHWRPIAFALALVAFAVWSQTGGYVVGDTTAGVFVTAILVAIVMGAISIVGPWMLQLVAIPMARSRYVSLVLAMRRILDDPKAVWRTVSSISLLSFIAGTFSVFPLLSDAYFVDTLSRDISTGILITLSFGFIVAALSTLMNQSSAIFDRASQTYALSQIGFPKRVFGLTRFFQVAGPLILTTVFAAGLGIFVSYSIAGNPDVTGLIRTGTVIGGGIALTLVALALCEPLERHVLANQRRAND